MSRYPRMDFYPADWLVGTSGMSPEARGAYIDLIAHAWDRGGSLPNDDAELRRMARMDKDEWGRVRDVVLAKFVETKDGRIRQRRVSAEIRRANERSKRASKAARARHSKHANGDKSLPAQEKCAPRTQAPSNAQVHAQTMPIISHQSPGDSKTPPSATETASPSQTPPRGGNGKSKPASSDRGARLAEDWRPSEQAIEYCRAELRATTEILNREYAAFMDWGLSATGPASRKRNWDRAFVNWIRRTMHELQEREARERRWAERRGQLAH